MTPELEAIRRAATGLLERRAALPAYEVPEALGLLEQMKAALLASGSGSGDRVDPAAVEAPPEADQWLTAAEVASMLRRTRAWVYRQARRWPFAKKLGRKTLLISKPHLERWVQRQVVAPDRLPQHDRGSGNPAGTA